MTPPALKPLSIRELKGAPLSILAVLFQHRPDGVSTSDLALESDYDVRTLRAPAGPLKLLAQHNYIVSPITVGQGGENIWFLSPNCPSLFSEPSAAIDMPTDTVLIAENDPDSPASTNGKNFRASPANERKISARPELRDSDSIKLNLDSESDSLAKPAENFRASETELVRQYKTALDAGKVFANIIRKRATELAAEGPAFLRDLLGHIAYWNSGKTDMKSCGAYVAEMSKHREPAPSSFIPPANLPFESALEWALNGGRTTAELATLKAEQDAARLAQLELEQADREFNATAPQPPPQADPETQSPLDILWRPVLRQLKNEMPPGAFNTWVRDTRLVSTTNHVYTIACSNAYAKDWLENRLRASFKRAIEQTLETTIADVEFVIA